MNVGFESTGLDVASIYFGWVSAIPSITQSEAVFTTATNTGSTISVLQMKYVATQGDSLQVFYLSYTTANTGPTNIVQLSFNYGIKVHYDSSNLPKQVYVATMVSSFQSTFSAGRTFFNIVPATKVGATYVPITTPQDYLTVYGVGRTFTSTGSFVTRLQYNQPLSVQFTLFIHRVNNPTETWTSSIGYTDVPVQSPGTVSQSISSNYCGNATVAPGKTLIRIVGSVGPYFFGASAGATNFGELVDAVDATSQTVVSVNTARIFRGCSYYFRCILCG